jgi:hypothetical protein
MRQWSVRRVTYATDGIWMRPEQASPDWNDFLFVCPLVLALAQTVSSPLVRETATNSSAFMRSLAKMMQFSRAMLQVLMVVG